MRIYVLTQEDAFYIPRMLDHLFAERSDVVGVGVVPGELRRRHFRRYLDMMGLRDFAVQSLNYARYRAGDVLHRVGLLRSSYSVRGAARRAAVQVEAVAKVNDPTFASALAAQGIDLIVSIACPQVFKKPILSVPEHGCINIHGALLPRFQGLLPSFWVLAKGETETGVTVHYMAEQLDAGDIILQQRVAIEPTDTVHSLVRRSKIDVGKRLLVRAIEMIEGGEVQATPMDLAHASYFSYPSAADVAEFRRRGRRFI